MARLVTLAQLCEEGLGTSSSALLLTAVDNGWALGFDGGGHLGLRVSEADRLRQEQHEQRAREAREAELRQRAREQSEIERAVAAEKQQQLRDRQRRLEERVGPLWAIEEAMRKAEWQQPGVFQSIQERDELARRVYTLEQIEEFAAREFNLDQAS